jgi:hypothetical protein
MVSMSDVILYLVVVFVALGSIVLATDVALAVMYARDYYRRHPELEPPDRYWVRIGLRGVR